MTEWTAPDMEVVVWAEAEAGAEAGEEEEEKGGAKAQLILMLPPSQVESISEVVLKDCLIMGMSNVFRSGAPRKDIIFPCFTKVA